MVVVSGRWDVMTEGHHGDEMRAEVSAEENFQTVPLLRLVQMP